MTITWTDDPNIPLSGPNDAIDFVVAGGDPAFISVAFGAVRAEEMAYRDGAFLHPYLFSTKSEAGAFSLKRSGGWPSSPTVRVEEKAGGGVAPWGVLYHVDFRTLPAATFGTPGQVTIDGLTWWLREKSGSSASVHSPKLNAGGFEIGGPVGVAEGYAFYRGRRMQLPLANVPGFNPDAPLVIYARTNTLRSGAVPIVGVVDCDVSAAAMGDTDYARRQGISRHQDQPPYAPYGGNDHWVWRGAVTEPASSALVTGCSEVETGIGLYVLNRSTVAALAFDWRGDAPHPATGAVGIDTGSPVWSISTGARRDMSKLVIDLAFNNNGGDATSAWLCELMLWQPGAGG